MLPLLAIVLGMIALMLFLIIDGEPLRFFLSRKFKLFSDLDFIQICILDIYLGGLILFTIAMLPFRLFSWVAVVGLTILCFLISVAINFKAVRSSAKLSRIKAFLKENRKILSDYVIVFAIFFIFFGINIMSASNLVFGSTRDESLHSLSVQVILENSQVPVTMHPYVEEGIIYPQASHVIFAYASQMLNMEVPEVVFYGTILFKSLSVIGAYFLGKKFCSRRVYSLGLSFVFAFMSNWPLSIVWGGNPFLVGFPFFLVCLGLLFSLSSSRMDHSLAELVILGLLFGYVGAIIISYLQTLMMIAFLVLAYYFARKHSGLGHPLREFALIFSVSLLPISPFLYRLIAFYQYPGHNIGIPSDFAGWAPQQLYASQALQWAFENLSPYALLRAIMILLVVSLAVLLWRTRNHKDEKPVIAFALAVFAAGALLSFISFLPTMFSVDFGVISWGHQGIILSISINVLIVALFANLSKLCQRVKLKHLPKILAKDSHATILLTILLLSSVTVPFLYYRFFVDPDALRGGYNMFAVTTRDDYDLMTWMRSNLSSDAVVLVHPYEAGLFIPAISHHRIVFPYTGSGLSSSYQALVGLTENDTLNATTYQLMQHWNISHVFVGSNIVYERFGQPKWNAELFLGNPNFKLVKNVGRAYLFKLEERDPNIVFLDDFGYTRWGENGWRNDFLGVGLGNVTITNGSGYNGSKCLRITAQAVPTVSQWELKYAYFVSRGISTSNSSDVTFSFYLDATQGFGMNDTFAVLISDIHSARSMVITTPNGVYDRYANAITLDERRGLFSYDLGRSWQQVFNSSLPNHIALSFVNYDFDGIRNVAYVDNIQVVCRPR